MGNVKNRGASRAPQAGLELRRKRQRDLGRCVSKAILERPDF